MKEQRQGDLNEYNPDWFRAARYGTDGAYRKVCAMGHNLTGGKCTLCYQDSKVLHHAQYWSLQQWVQDVWDLMHGRQIKAPWYQPDGRGSKRQKLGGLTQGREQHGKSAFVLCSKCHDKVHQRKYWKALNDRNVAVWHNCQHWPMLWRLRLAWRLKNIATK